VDAECCFLAIPDALTDGGARRDWLLGVDAETLFSHEPPTPRIFSSFGPRIRDRFQSRQARQIVSRQKFGLRLRPRSCRPVVEKVDEVADGFENGTHSLELQIYGFLWVDYMRTCFAAALLCYKICLCRVQSLTCERALCGPCIHFERPAGTWERRLQRRNDPKAFSVENDVNLLQSSSSSVLQRVVFRRSGFLGRRRTSFSAKKKGPRINPKSRYSESLYRMGHNGSLYVLRSARVVK
jgi:hypothetical protein